MNTHCNECDSDMVYDGDLLYCPVCSLEMENKVLKYTLSVREQENQKLSRDNESLNSRLRLLHEVLKRYIIYYKTRNMHSEFESNNELHQIWLPAKEALKGESPDSTIERSEIESEEG